MRLSYLYNGNLYTQKDEASEWWSLTADIEIHVIHISSIIITYTLELPSHLKKIMHNLHITINF